MLSQRSGLNRQRLLYSALSSSTTTELSQPAGNKKVREYLSINANVKTWNSKRINLTVTCFSLLSKQKGRLFSFILLTDKYVSVYTSKWFRWHKLKYLPWQNKLHRDNGNIWRKRKCYQRLHFYENKVPCIVYKNIPLLRFISLKNNIKIIFLPKQNWDHSKFSDKWLVCSLHRKYKRYGMWFDFQQPSLSRKLCWGVTNPWQSLRNRLIWLTRG